MRVAIADVFARPLSVPLRDPFVIASARVEVTRSVEVTVVLASGERGIGEAAALPPVTREDQPDVLDAVARAAPSLVGRDATDLGSVLDQSFEHQPLARAGVETAVLDAVARRVRMPLRALLGGARGAATDTLVTDITIPILPQERMVALAIAWRARGFSCFKVKVGKDLDRDLAALEAIHRATPGASFRIDANAAFTASEAIHLARQASRLGLVVECYEQPCAARDLDAMAEVTRAVDVPVVADESVATLEDLGCVLRAGAARGVNLKLAKSGGPLGALAVGQRARAAGMAIMVGGMVETRLGMTAAAHVAAALGGVEFPDLDTAWLLADDPYRGGYRDAGATMTLEGDGLGVTGPDQ